MLHVHPHEIVVATGAAEIHPVCPGNRLAGLVTARAAEKLDAAGVDLGRRRRRSTRNLGPLRGRGRPRHGRRDDRPGDAAPRRRRRPTPSSSTSGLAPRDLLARMAGVRAGRPSSATPPPTSRSRRRRPRASSAAAWARRSRTSPASGTAASPSSSCSSAPARPVSDRARAAPACPTSGRGSRRGPARCPSRSRPGRPRARSPSPRPPPTATSTSSAGPRSTTSTSPLGARMDRFGGWWRPWHYGDAVAEYWAVREGVSIGDVSHARQAGRLRAGRRRAARAALPVPRRGHQARPVALRAAAQRARPRHRRRDDLRESETRFVLTFTSGGAANAEMWVRDWIETWGLDVHVLDRTMSLAAINVTGPLAADLLRRAGLADPPRFLGHVHADVAGVPCHVMRLSFTGEAAFELHHPIDRSVELWRALLDLGARPRHPAARPPGAVRAAAREGPRHRRHGHRARHDAAPARDGLGGADGQAALHRPRGARADGQAARRAALARLHDAGHRADRGSADLVGRRDRRQRDRRAGRRRCSARR